MEFFAAASMEAISLCEFRRIQKIRNVKAQRLLPLPMQLIVKIEMFEVTAALCTRVMAVFIAHCMPARRAARFHHEKFGNDTIDNSIAASFRAPVAS